MKLSDDEKKKIHEKAKKEYVKEIEKIEKEKAKKEAQYHGLPFFVVWIRKLYDFFEDL